MGSFDDAVERRLGDRDADAASASAGQRDRQAALEAVARQVAGRFRSLAEYLENKKPATVIKLGLKPVRGWKQGTQRLRVDGNLYDTYTKRTVDVYALLVEQWSQNYQARLRGYDFHFDRDGNFRVSYNLDDEMGPNYVTLDDFFVETAADILQGR